MNKLKDVKKIGKKMKKSKADKWVKEYQKNHEGETFGWLYGTDILKAVLEVDGSNGIWFFKGTNDDGEERLVMYPADHEGNILKKNIKSLGAMAGKDSGDDEGAADESSTCPPNCPGGLG